MDLECFIFSPFAGFCNWTATLTSNMSAYNLTEISELMSICFSFVTFQRANSNCIYDCRSIDFSQLLHNMYHITDHVTYYGTIHVFF